MVNRKEYMKKWRKDNHDKVLKIRKKWSKENSACVKKWKKVNIEKCRTYTLKSMMKYYYGGNREIALKRDNYQCVKCGMTDTDHRKKWGCSIIVHHIDGRGYNCNEKNNNIENLQTLCCKCHGKEENPNSGKVYCKRGHKFTEENTYLNDGHRSCRTCRRSFYGR